MDIKISENQREELRILIYCLNSLIKEKKQEIEEVNKEYEDNKNNFSDVGLGWLEEIRAEKEKELNKLKERKNEIRKRYKIKFLNYKSLKY